MIHFEESTAQRRKRLGGYVHAQAFCGNGNYHALKTKQLSEVTCNACIDGITKHLGFYFNNNTGELINYPAKLHIKELQTVHTLLINQKQYISASRIQHLINCQ